MAVFRAFANILQRIIFAVVICFSFGFVSNAWAVNYVLSYDCGAGSGTAPSSVTVSNGGTRIIAENTCTPSTGYYFSHWSCQNQTGGNAYDKYPGAHSYEPTTISIGSETGNITCTALWTNTAPSCGNNNANARQYMTYHYGICDISFVPGASAYGLDGDDGSTMNTFPTLAELCAVDGNCVDLESCGIGSDAIFNGWDCGGTVSNDSCSPSVALNAMLPAGTSGCKIYFDNNRCNAECTANITYHVTYQCDANGTGTTAGDPVTAGQSYTFRTPGQAYVCNEFISAGYTFDKWHCTNNVGNRDAGDIVSTWNYGDTICTASWNWGNSGLNCDGNCLSRPLSGLLDDAATPADREAKPDKPNMWGLSFSYGDVVGNSFCADDPNPSQLYETAQSVNGSGAYCWCNATEFTPAGDRPENIITDWIYVDDFGGDPGLCEARCADKCAEEIMAKQSVREILYGGVNSAYCDCDNTVTYTCGDGVGTPPNADSVVGAQNVNTPNTAGSCTHPDFSFTGWSCKGGSVTVNPGGSVYVDSDIFCHALWNCSDGEQDTRMLGNLYPGYPEQIWGEGETSCEAEHTEDKGIIGDYYVLTFPYGDVYVVGRESSAVSCDCRVERYAPAGDGGTYDVDTTWIPGYRYTGQNCTYSCGQHIKQDPNFRCEVYPGHYCESKPEEPTPTHTITIDKNGGSGTVTAYGQSASGASNLTFTCTEGDTITISTNNFTKSHATFDSWDSGNPFSCDQDRTVRAVWINDTYNVTYTCGEGSGNPPTDNTNYTYNSVVQMLGNTCSEPSAGRTFAGYKCNGNWETSTFRITENTTCIAQWHDASTYTVSYGCGIDTTGNGPTDSNSPYASGTTVTVLANNDCAKTNSTFAGWECGGNTYAAGDQFTISGNTTCTAQWNANTTYTVSYECGTGATGNGPTDGNSYYAGDAVTVLANNDCVKTNYTFNGWSCAGTTYAAGATFGIAANTTCTAQWTETMYSMVYSCGDGTGTPPATVSYTPGNTVTIVNNGSNNCTISNGAFGGWKCNGTDRSVGSSFQISEDTLCVAQWSCSAGFQPESVVLETEGLTVDFSENGTRNDAQSHVAFSYGDVYYGYVCGSGTLLYQTSMDTPVSSANGQGCWCRINQYGNKNITLTPWVFIRAACSNDNNSQDCSYVCARAIGSGAVSGGGDGSTYRQLLYTSFMCDPNTIRLVWMKDSESIAGPEMCIYGTPGGITDIPQPEKPGYTFAGWITSAWNEN